VVPVEIFFFFVWVPDLVIDRLTGAFPGKRHQYPFQAQPPTSLHFVLEKQEIENDTHIKRLVYGEFHEDVPKAPSDPDYVNDMIDRIPRIYSYENWKPSLDSRLLIFAIAIFSALPDDIQAVIFEEIFSFSPLLSVILGGHLIAVMPRRIRSGAVLLLALVIIFAIYATIELIRYFTKIATRYYKKQKYGDKKAARLVYVRPQVDHD